MKSPASLSDGDKPDALFAATIPAAGAKDDSGKPAQPSMDPVAFFQNGRLLGCEAPDPHAQDPVPQAVYAALNRLYKQGLKHQILWGGDSWGSASIAKSTALPEDQDGVLDLSALFEAHPNSNTTVAAHELRATVWTGTPLETSHPAKRARGSASERAAFLDAAAAVYSTHHVRVASTSIHSGAIEKTQLRSGHIAVSGNAVVQLASATPRTYYSYRLFLMIEDQNGKWVPVATNFHRTTLRLDPTDALPKTGELIDEENSTDIEEFVDNVPLFRGEPDAIVTQHRYYEDWAYSIYRWVKGQYQLIYSGCGGGD